MVQAVESELREQLKLLPLDQQQKVLEFARSLVSTRIRGIPGKNLLHFAGSIDKEALEAMKEAIEENCEKIDVNEW
jgi:hypothetical protein